MIRFTYLALATSVVLQTSDAQGTILNDSYFYGQSPLVEPPPGTGSGDWTAAYARARFFVSQLTLEEMVNLTGGYSGPNGCSGNIPPLIRLGFPGMCLQDAGNGVRATDFVNGYPSGLHVGASWNKDLAYQRATYLGGEFRAKGVNVALGPVVGPLGKTAEAGRNWEGFSNDPYLCGALAAETVVGIQSNGVIASTKHFIGNEQELNRNPIKNADNNTIESLSANVDDKTLHELYLWPFVDAVHAGTGSIMCSYNRINNSYACQNSKTQNGILKTELGYQGFVVSDWNAQHSGVASALGGLEMVMPSSTRYWGGNLTQAILNGSVPESRLNDMVTRIMASWYQMGQDSSDYPPPGIGMPKDILAPHTIINARDPASKPTLLQGAVEGHVLVKNTANALPLSSPALLSIFGYSARAASQDNPYSSSSGLYTLWFTGYAPSYLASALCHSSANGSSTTASCPPPLQIAPNGTLISGGGSGAVTPPYISSPLDALIAQAQVDNTALFWDLVNVNATSFVNPASTACLVFLNAWATESIDRPGLADSHSDTLVTNIAAQCNNTIVIIHNAGVRLVDAWIDNPNVTAVVFAHLPGQDSGTALVDILYGRVSPSGKLPYSVAKREADYGDLLAPVEPVTPYELFPQDDFSEGEQIDYRAFDAQGVDVRFEFGFGLSYTTFAYGGLSVQLTNASTGTYPEAAILPGGREDLWDVLATVSVEVANTGDTLAKEVAQLYVRIPGAVVGKQLRGFDKQELLPGETKVFTFELTRRDLSIWDVVAQEWMLGRGDYTVEVGASSRNLPTSGMLKIE